MLIYFSDFFVIIIITASALLLLLIRFKDNNLNCNSELKSADKAL